jgi:hypothetical protein
VTASSVASICANTTFERVEPPCIAAEAVGQISAVRLSCR